jgi:hypothetical protein
MKKYEYDFQSHSKKLDGGDDSVVMSELTMLNERGGEGWELVAVVKETVNVNTYYFKREIPIIS